MKKTLIIIGIILSLGAVSAFSYLSSGTGTQGMIRKKSGEDDLVYKRNAEIDIGRSRELELNTRSYIVDCNLSYSNVNKKLDVINAALTKIEANKLNGNDLFEADPNDPLLPVVTEIESAYVEGMNEFLNAIPEFDTAYTGYKNNGCQKEECSIAIKNLDGKLAERYAVHATASNLTIEDMKYKSQYKKEYHQPYNSLKVQYNNTLNKTTQSNLAKQMNDLKDAPHNIETYKKMKEILEAEKAIAYGDDKTKAPGLNNKSPLMKVEEAVAAAITTFKTQCGK